MWRSVALVKTNVSEERIASIIGVQNNQRASNNFSSVRFEVFTAVTMKNGVFWVVTPCGSCKNLRFGGT
jgi:hypothetical protein